jgi:hypothetical protein
LSRYFSDVECLQFSVLPPHDLALIAPVLPVRSRRWIDDGVLDYDPMGGSYAFSPIHSGADCFEILLLCNLAMAPRGEFR